MSQLKERLEADMKEALRAKDSLRLQTIRGVRGAIKNKEIEVGAALDDDGVMRVIRSLAKQREESIEQYAKAGREDLVNQETRERDILQAYLPAAPDAAAIEAMVRAVIQELGATSAKEMGRVMKVSLERLGPAADGKIVSNTAKQLLSGN